MYKNSILLVDDEEDIVFIFRKSLELKGFHAFGFTDSALALEHFKTNSESYSLVISDIRMPHMNGFEFAKRIRMESSTVKLLLMTAFELNDFEYSEILPSLKIDGFLRKPMTPAQFNDAVARYLSSANAS